MASSGSELGPMLDYCEHDNEPSGSIEAVSVYVTSSLVESVCVSVINSLRQSGNCMYVHVLVIFSKMCLWISYNS
jgi:hypothetical protein